MLIPDSGSGEFELGESVCVEFDCFWQPVNAVIRITTVRKITDLEVFTQFSPDDELLSPLI